MFGPLNNYVKTFLLDNYDSFTYNIVQLLEYVDACPVVRRNTDITIAGIKKINPNRIIISPGPMRPGDHPLIFELIGEFYKTIPILGVCLGMQAINEFFGGTIKEADVPVHGKTSLIHHVQRDIFEGIPSPFRAARYHSLIVSDVGAELQTTATITKGPVMALRHKRYPVFGVQFHPESYLTEYGSEVITNFINL